MSKYYLPGKVIPELRVEPEDPLLVDVV